MTKTFELPTIESVQTVDEARQLAIGWQTWLSKHELFYSELVEYQVYFEDLANTFGLHDEFKENGII